MSIQTEDEIRLQNHVVSIAEDLNNEELGENEEGESASYFDYVLEALDLQYIINADKSFRSGKILVCFGGPNIWVNTDTGKVEGYWWGDYAEADLNKYAIEQLDAVLEELYNC